MTAIYQTGAHRCGRHHHHHRNITSTHMRTCLPIYHIIKRRKLFFCFICFFERNPMAYRWRRFPIHTYILSFHQIASLCFSIICKPFFGIVFIWLQSKTNICLSKSHKSNFLGRIPSDQNASENPTRTLNIQRWIFDTFQMVLFKYTFCFFVSWMWFFFTSSYSLRDANAFAN